MIKNRVPSALFVGREKELGIFKDLLKLESDKQVLNIHTKGVGGIGKTRLLTKMQKYCQELESDLIIYAENLIDFYHAESRTKKGVLIQIAENLGDENFPEFNKLNKICMETPDSSERRRLEEKLEQIFLDEYRQFSENNEKVIVLFFDTYEFIQDVDQIEQKAEGTDFSQWLETELFPKLNHHTRLIVSGRYLLKELDLSPKKIQEINLNEFSFPETKEFLKRCFKINPDEDNDDLKLLEQLKLKEDEKDLIEIFHQLSRGRPILLALFVDWVNYERNVLFPKELLSAIEKKTGEKIKYSNITNQEKDLFEKALIQRVTMMEAPEDQAVTYMAIAYRRMTPEMFHAITGEPLEKCRKVLLEDLKELSFIKYKEENIVLLHDEMRRLVIEHYWKEQDLSGGDLPREIIKKLIDYYNKKLLKDIDSTDPSWEIYNSELVEYYLFENSKEGIESFNTEFKLAMDEGRYDYVGLILREAETFERMYSSRLLSPDKYYIFLHRREYNVETDKETPEVALGLIKDVIEKYKKDNAWKDNVIWGDFLLVKGSIESINLDKFEDAVKSFEESKNIFYLVGEDYKKARATIRIGYAYYLQSKFVEAERQFNNAINALFDLLVERKDSLASRDIQQQLQYAFGNLAVLYRHTGQFEKAIQHAEIQLSIVRNLPRNNLEIARARNTTGQVFAFAGREIDAKHHLSKADELLKEIENQLLKGRLKTNQCWLRYRTKEFANLIESYRAEELIKISEGKVEYVTTEDIEEALKLIDEAINTLQDESPYRKELADAYFVQGELFVVSHEWEKAEDSLLKALYWGKESKFLYRVIDTLESLVTLYYFWNYSGHIDAKTLKATQEKMGEYQNELNKYDRSLYPNLWGRYEVTLGDIEFDRVLKLLSINNQTIDLDRAVNHLKKAFDHYVKSAKYKKEFNEERYYLILRVFYNRLDTLIDRVDRASGSSYSRQKGLMSEPKQEISSDILDRLDEIKTCWKDSEYKSDFERLYEYICLQIDPNLAKPDRKIDNLRDDYRNAKKRGNFYWASLLSDCLIEIYSVLSLQQYEEYYEYLILRHCSQCGLYRILGNEYQAKWHIDQAEEALAYFSKQLSTEPYLKEALEGRIASSKGELEYRRGEYGKLLEFYLRGELKKTREEKFDKQFPGSRQKAEDLLKEAIEKLKNALDFWNKKAKNDGKNHLLEQRIELYSRKLSETYFRLGELLMLNENSDDALNNLENSFKLANEYNYEYREVDALQSYLNALYFADREDEFEKYREIFLNSAGWKYPSIMARFKIIEGDYLYSKCFPDDDKPNINIIDLRKMLKHYVEACNFKSQFNRTSFDGGVRVLQRRIELIPDKTAVEVIHNGLRELWEDQEYLANESGVLETLLKFAKIRMLTGRFEKK